MNSLNKIKIFFMCTSLFILCLLLNVSYAEFTETLVPRVRIMEDSNNSSITYGDYTGTQVRTIIQNYSFDMDNSDYSSAFSSLCDYLDNLGYNVYLYSYSYDESSSPYYYFSVVKKELADIGFIYRDDISQFYSLYSLNIAPGSIHDIAVFNSINSKYRRLTTYLSPGDVYNDSTKECHYPASINVHYASTSIKKISYSSGYFWDGESYFYKVPVDNPDSPTMPTNAEIASAVQAFYNSDFYKNNKEFSDFLVVYNMNNGYFDFIGHTLGNILGQVIIPPNYRFEGKMYSSQWWEFFIDENSGPSPYGTSYYLYSSNDLGENIIYNGIGKISELLDLSFGTNSVIVYSTTDYPVRTYVLDESTGDYTYTDGVIEGDQYTYDENLDPTENGYNPLDNFVTVDPSQTIVNNADFSNISDSFEQFKDLFSFNENMQWLVIANNKLSNYFLGFIVMCCLFITLGRILRG